MTSSFNSLSKDVTRDMAQTMTKVEEKIKTFNKNIIEGIGDDCAIVKFSSRKKYVITSDTSLLGPHFSKAVSYTHLRAHET